MKQVQESDVTKIHMVWRYSEALWLQNRIVLSLIESCSTDSSVQLILRLPPSSDQCLSKTEFTVSSTDSTGLSTLTKKSVSDPLWLDQHCPTSRIEVLWIWRLHDWSEEYGPQPKLEQRHHCWNQGKRISTQVSNLCFQLSFIPDVTEPLSLYLIIITRHDMKRIPLTSNQHKRQVWRTSTSSEA